MSGPLRALLLAAALLLAWTAGRSELLLREWRDWRAFRTGEPAVAEAADGTVGALADTAPSGDAALLRALSVLAGALAQRPGAGAGVVAGPPGPAAAPVPVPVPAAAASGTAELAGAMAAMAREGAADRAALANALEVLALALAERERAGGPVLASAPGGPAAGGAGANPSPAHRPDGMAGEASASARPADVAGERAAWALADRGYAALREGDRRLAAESFQGALVLAPDHPEARAWRTEERRLTRRVRLDAYALARAPADVPTGAVSATPVLGAAGVSLTGALRPWPLARRPVEAFARYAAGQPGDATAADTGQVAVGVAWRPVPGSNATVAVERLIAAGALARDDWAVRVAGGREARLRGLTLAGYGEAGVIPDGFDWFAGGQASAEKRGSWRGVSWAAGAGLWAAGQQTGDATIGRIDLGPLVRMSHPSVPAVLQIDYRLRAAGDAEPGSGPTVTVSSSF